MIGKASLRGITKLLSVIMTRSRGCRRVFIGFEGVLPCVEASYSALCTVATTFKLPIFCTYTCALQCPFDAYTHI